MMKTNSRFNNTTRRQRRTASPWGPSDRVWRYVFVRILLSFVFFIIFVRLVQIQIVDRKKYVKQALEQYTRELVVKANRGHIYDRKLTPLALNKPCFDLGIDKKYVKDMRKTSRNLARVLEQSELTIQKKIRNSRNFVLLARKLDKDDAAVIKLMDMPGVRVIPTTERVYPLNEKLAHVLGFVDVDGHGISGIELRFDNYLSGKDGKSVLQKDAFGNVLMQVSSSLGNRESGHDVILTIDHVYQTIAEEELKKTVTQYSAQGGCVIITEPHSGKILAMASQPGFDANRATEYPPEIWRIRPVTDIFEPGSTYKIVTMAAAVSLGIDKIKTEVNCENGTYRIFGEEINDSKKYGVLSFDNIFVKSSNIGTAKIATEIGKNELFKMSRSFGFGNPTGIDLPGEVSGILKRPTEWSRFSLAAISYGHEVAVTQLQIAMAYGAIANGGQLMRPIIVEEVRSQDKQTLFKSVPQVIRRLMTSKTSEKLTGILQNVVAKGTGKQAKIANVSIAGKTGTAQKLLSNKSGYSNTAFVASFAGFYPSEHPDILIYVTVDEPNPAHSGGQVAAPTFRNILERIMEIRNPAGAAQTRTIVQAQDSAQNSLIPDCTLRRQEIAAGILKEYGIVPKILGSGSFIKDQKLLTSDDEEKELEIVLTLTDYPKETEYVTVPSLADDSLRKALNKLSAQGLRAKVTGSGRVVKQDPKAGSKIRVGARCYLICEPVFNKGLVTR
ncbi:MAG: penicillin-binding transpeptidase domain-containing protein [bacterium]